MLNAYAAEQAPSMDELIHLISACVITASLTIMLIIRLGDKRWGNG